MIENRNCGINKQWPLQYKIKDSHMIKLKEQSVILEPSDACTHNRSPHLFC